MWGFSKVHYKTTVRARHLKRQAYSQTLALGNEVALNLFLIVKKLRRRKIFLLSSVICTLSRFYFVTFTTPFKYVIIKWAQFFRVLCETLSRKMFPIVFYRTMCYNKHDTIFSLYNFYIFTYILSLYALFCNKIRSFCRIFYNFHAFPLVSKPLVFTITTILRLLPPFPLQTRVYNQNNTLFLMFFDWF